MEGQLLRDENGWFPADLMIHIANYVCVRTVTAMLLTSKYWNKIINPLLEHPAVTILYGPSESLLTRTMYHFRRGQGYYLWSKDKEDGVYPRERRQDSEAFIGYFKSLIEMRKFFGDLRNAVTEPNPDIAVTEDNQLTYDYCVIIGNSVEHMQYYDLKVPWEADPLALLTATKRTKIIENLLRESGFINVSHFHSYDEHMSIQIRHKMKKYNQDLEMTILADGDVICGINGKVFRSYRVRTSKKLFDKLVDIVKYSKHKHKMEDKDDASDQQTIYSFNLEYKPPLHGSEIIDKDNSDDSDEDKKPSLGYYIQHKVRRNLNTNRSAIETNGYKTGALEKIVKLLEDALFNPKLKGPTLIKEKRVILPPQSKGNALFDSVRFDPKLRSVGISNIFAIAMNIEEYKLNRTDKYIIAVPGSTSLADLKTTLKFFCRVEDVLLESDQEKKIKDIKHVLNSRYRITSVNIYTYGPMPIVEIPKAVLDLIADQALKVFPSLNSTENTE